MAGRFDLFDLQLFTHVAEARSLTRGADRACISPAAASARIKQMEESIGTRLLYRTAQGVTTTPAGDTLLHHARRVAQQLSHLQVDLLEHVRGAHGHVRMLANTSSITESLPDALAQFLAAHPGVAIDLKEQLSADIVRAVADGSTDVGIVAGSVRVEGLQSRPFGHDQLVLCVPAGHAFARRRGVAFADTLDEHFVGLSEGSAIHGFLARIAEQIGRTMKLRIHVGSFEAICRLVEAKVGIGIVTESSGRRHARTMAVRLVPLTDPWARRDLHVVVRDVDTLPAVARDLVDHLERFAQAREKAVKESG